MTWGKTIDFINYFGEVNLMEWKINHTLACPKTGTSFAQISTSNLRLILWYRGDYFLREGNIVATNPFGVIVNDRITEIEFIHAFPFTMQLWESFKTNTDCPGNQDPLITKCCRRPHCLLQNCPYGVTAKN
jgi:hypothetical protein